MVSVCPCVARGGWKLSGPGLLFVVSGPSGAGKDTLVAALLARKKGLRYSISATTRAPRPGELDGHDYFFLAREAFEARMKAGGFLETREYNGNLYGTPRAFIEEQLWAGYDIIMKPEVNGALAIQRTYPGAALIFVIPDRFSHLRSRLEARRTETNDEIAARLAIAHEEMQSIRHFDYLIINEQEHPDDAVADLEAIIRAERFRIHRYSESRIKELEQE